MSNVSINSLTVNAKYLLQASFASVLLSSLSACDSQGILSSLRLNHEDVFSLKAGSCFNDDKKIGGDVATVAMRNCEDSHDNEVYFTYKLPDGKYPAHDYPMYEKCGEEFDKFIGAAYENSRYEFDIMLPTEYSWKQDDREVVCFLFDGDYKKIKGSVRNYKK